MRNPNYQFVEVDSGKLEQDMIQMYERITGSTVYPASPERLFIDWVCAVLAQAYSTMNYIGNQNIPSRAEGENLDALGELFYSVNRPQAKPALSIERFYISEAQMHDIIIPAGTRVTNVARGLVFETVSDAVIDAGETFADVRIRCQTPGTIGNGYAVGQINTTIDVFEYYSECTNIEKTDGGSDMATDDEFYKLLQTAQDAFSTAGPIGAYEYHAKSVSTEIIDVKVVRPKRRIRRQLFLHRGADGLESLACLGGSNFDISSLTVDGAVLDDDYSVYYKDSLLEIWIGEDSPLHDLEHIWVEIDENDAGRIDIYALMADGSPASQTVKDLILEACNDSKVRPLTDLVSVKDPVTVNCSIDVTYFTADDSTASPSTVAAAVNAAVEEFKTWQTCRIGRDLNPSKLTELIMATGVVKRVVVTSPEFRSLKDGSDHMTPELAVISSTTIRNGGVEDD